MKIQLFFVAILLNSLTHAAIAAEATGDANEDSTKIVTLSWASDMSTYTDVRPPTAEGKAYYKSIQITFDRLFQKLANRYLPEDARLEVEVVQLDLAGDVRTSSVATNTRIFKRTDPPSMILSYTLTNGKGELVLTREQEELRNLNYLSGSTKFKNSRFQHEKYLIESWFRRSLMANLKSQQANL